MKRIASACRLLVLFSAVLLTAVAAVADAPPDRYTYPAAGTVYDTRTKLTWQRTVDAKSRSWSEAKDYCAGLSLAGTGWRLPTRLELLTLVDRTRYAPAIDPTAFPGTPKATFWTSTPSRPARPTPGSWSSTTATPGTPRPTPCIACAVCVDVDG